VVVGNSFGGVNSGAIPLLNCSEEKLRIDEKIYQQTTIYLKKFVKSKNHMWRLYSKLRRIFLS